MQMHTRSISQYDMQQVYIMVKLEKISLLLIIGLVVYAWGVNFNDLVVNKEACSRTCAVSGGSDAICLSYGPIGIVG